MNTSTFRLTAFLIVSSLWLQQVPTQAGSARVFPAGERPHDRRLAPLKDLDGFFPFRVPASNAEWEARREALQRRVMVACGIWPWPERTPLNAVIHGRIERDGFSVERVYFESIPHHFVTGLLFRPIGKTGKLPAVLCPHGHGGRLKDLGEDGVRWAIVNGQERFERSGRYPKLARCAQLARMGCVTFIFDMIGYADSVQLPFELVHRYAKQRPHMNGMQRWGFFSTQAELRLQSVFGLQSWNAIRALDFLCGLPDVDAQRVAVTGGSGGGTQTIMLCAVDPRPVAAFPQGMVSTSMQGGCTCENCSLLRIGTGNVELAALFAPKPQGMTAADDWTRDMMKSGFPQLRQLYSMLGASDKVMCKPLLHFPHNYNYVTRAIMYSWFNQHLGLGLAEPVVEEDFLPLDQAELSVWNDEHPQPEAGSEEYEIAITQWLDRQSRRQLERIWPVKQGDGAEFRHVVGGAWQTIIGRSADQVGPIERVKVAKTDAGDYWRFADILKIKRHAEELPLVSLYPKSQSWNGDVVIWLERHGKDAMFLDNGMPKHEIAALLQAGTAVISADLFGQGEFCTVEDDFSSNRSVENPREFAGYTYGYNHPLFVQRVHDVMSLVAFVRGNEQQTKRVCLVGVHGAAPWVVAARAVLGDVVDKMGVDSFEFRFADVESYLDPAFVPGAVKYGDLAALLALSAPQPAWIGGRVPEIVRQVYQAAGHPRAIQAGTGLEQMTAWIAGP